jgi:hypothetical protein
VESDRFDHLARVLAGAGTRRHLLGALAGAPVLGGLLAVLDPEEAEAKKRRRRRKKRRRKRKGKADDKRQRKQDRRACKPRPQDVVCAGRCGSVKNKQTCGKTVDCGSCDCDPPCSECFTCQGNGDAPGTCVPQAGAPCGPGQTCQNGVLQPQGTCDGSGSCVAADPVSCAPYLLCDGSTCASTCAANDECTDLCCDGACQECCADADCGSNALCVDGVCHACDVTCDDDPGACGEALQAALEDESLTTIYVCPGTYQGGFNIYRSVTVIGAGGGAAPATNTVLSGNTSLRVLRIHSEAGPVVLAGLHITGGRANGAPGAGLFHEGTSLLARDCTIAGNKGVGAIGAGIYQLSGSMTLVRCTIRNNENENVLGVAEGNGGGMFVTGNASTTLEDCQVLDNHADNTGGGIFISLANVILAGTTTVSGNSAFNGGGIWAGGGTLEIAETCQVTGNEAFASNGGGIRQAGGAVTLLGTDPSSIVINNCHENCVGNVPKCASTPVYCPA